MTQSRLGSAIEVAANIVIGFAINWVVNLVVLPLYGFQVSPGQAFSMGLVFTVIAIVRGYVLRRYFNARLHAATIRFTGEKA